MKFDLLSWDSTLEWPLLTLRLLFLKIDVKSVIFIYNLSAFNNVQCLTSFRALTSGDLWWPQGEFSVKLISALGRKRPFDMYIISSHYNAQNIFLLGVIKFHLRSSGVKFRPKQRVVKFKLKLNISAKDIQKINFEVVKGQVRSKIHLRSNKVTLILSYKILSVISFYFCQKNVYFMFQIKKVKIR